jgi:hypothetical protein
MHKGDPHDVDEEIRAWDWSSDGNEIQSKDYKRVIKGWEEICGKKGL